MVVAVALAVVAVVVSLFVVLIVAAVVTVPLLFSFLSYICTDIHVYIIAYRHAPVRRHVHV